MDAISFEVQPGEVVGFLGPNGAGKSTTMKILTGYIPQSSGTATVCGYDVVGQSMQVRQHVGYLPEHNPLYSDLYVREYLGFVARIHGLRTGVKARIEEMIERTGLGIESRKKIGQLSKGYRQRVGLAQAMLHDPDVLILDEPTSGLDPNQLTDIRQVIKSLGREKTVILSTHIMQEVQAICDRIIIINRGKLVANDTTEVLTQQLQGQRMVALELVRPMDIALVRGLKGVERVEQQAPASYRIYTKDSIDIREALFRLAVQHDNPILSLTHARRDLEEVFRSLTRQEPAPEN